MRASCETERFAHCLLPQIDYLPEHFSVIDAIFETETPIINAIKRYEKAVSKLSMQNSRENQENLESHC